LRLLLVFCTVPFWYTQQLYFQHTLRPYISHGTDTIMKQYDTGRTEIPFGPFGVFIWVSPVAKWDLSLFTVHPLLVNMAVRRTWE
jgi:hypothetical protein